MKRILMVIATLAIVLSGMFIPQTMEAQDYDPWAFCLEQLDTCREYDSESNCVAIYKECVRIYLQMYQRP